MDFSKLQVLERNSDLSIFDPGSSIAVKFFASLHELLPNLEPTSTTLWSALCVISHACGNPAARHALTHTYKFVSILTTLLDGTLIEDKKIQVLRLLQVSSNV